LASAFPKRFYMPSAENLSSIPVLVSWPISAPPPLDPNPFWP